MLPADNAVVKEVESVFVEGNVANKNPATVACNQDCQTDDVGSNRLVQCQKAGSVLWLIKSTYCGSLDAAEEEYLKQSDQRCYQVSVDDNERREPAIREHVLKWKSLGDLDGKSRIKLEVRTVRQWCH